MDQLPPDIIGVIGNKLCIGQRLQWALTNKRLLTIIEDKYEEEICQHRKSRGCPKRDFLWLVSGLVSLDRQHNAFLETLAYEIIRQHPNWVEKIDTNHYVIQNNLYRLSLKFNCNVPKIELDRTISTRKWKANGSLNSYTVNDHKSVHRKDFAPLIQKINPARFRQEALFDTSCQRTAGQTLDILFDMLRPTPALMTNLVQALIKIFYTSWEVMDNGYFVILDNYKFEVQKEKLIVMNNDLIVYECVHRLDEQDVNRIKIERKYVPGKKKIQGNKPTNGSKYIVYGQINSYLDNQEWSDFWDCWGGSNIKADAISSSRRNQPSRVVVMRQFDSFRGSARGIPSAQLLGQCVYLSESLVSYGQRETVLDKNGRHVKMGY